MFLMCAACVSVAVPLGVGGPVPQPGLGGPGPADVRTAGYEELTPLVLQLSEQDKVGMRASCDSSQHVP